jgi:hypothetical protein
MQVYSDMEREITRELAILKEKEHKLNINTQKINETAKGNQL